jgi:hypothetical protein
VGGKESNAYPRQQHYSLKLANYMCLMIDEMQMIRLMKEKTK